MTSQSRKTIGWNLNSYKSKELTGKELWPVFTETKTHTHRKTILMNGKAQNSKNVIEKKKFQMSKHIQDFN